MTTYAETQGHEPFNWLTALKPGLTTEEVEKLAALAGEWPTCACGNQDAAIPRWTLEEKINGKVCSIRIGRPKDEVLAYLGSQFYEQLRAATYAKAQEDIDEYVKNARDIFLKIELRAAELMNSI